MRELQTTQLELTDTEVEGMIRCGWEPGTQIRLGDYKQMICLDGRVWKIIGQRGEIIGFLRPENCRSSVELKSEIKNVLSQED